MARAILIILDGLGVGGAPDAADYGDAGSDTLGNLATHVGGLDLPHVLSLVFQALLLVLAKSQKGDCHQSNQKQRQAGHP